MNWVNAVKDRDYWLAVVHMVMNLGFLGMQEFLGYLRKYSLLNKNSAAWNCLLHVFISIRTGWSGNRIQVEERFSSPIQTGLWAHPASYTMSTRSLSWG